MGAKFNEAGLGLVVGGVGLAELYLGKVVLTKQANFHICTPQMVCVCVLM